LTGGYDDFNQVHHDAIINSFYLPQWKLPLAPFTLASSSLGLLLGTSSCCGWALWCFFFVLNVLYGGLWERVVRIYIYIYIYNIHRDVGNSLNTFRFS
jgi:hypothetical protein